MHGGGPCGNPRVGAIEGIRELGRMDLPPSSPVPEIPAYNQPPVPLVNYQRSKTLQCPWDPSLAPPPPDSVLVQVLVFCKLDPLAGPCMYLPWLPSRCPGLASLTWCRETCVGCLSLFAPTTVASRPSFLRPSKDSFRRLFLLADPFSPPQFLAR